MLYLKRNLQHYAVQVQGEFHSKVTDIGVDLSTNRVSSIFTTSGFMRGSRKYEIPIKMIQHHIDHQTRTINFSRPLENHYLLDQGTLWNRSNRLLLKHSLAMGSRIAFHSVEDGPIDSCELELEGDAPSTFNHLSSLPVFDDAKGEFCGNLVDVIISHEDFSLKFFSIKKPFRENLLYVTCRNIKCEGSTLLINARRQTLVHELAYAESL